MYVIVIAWEEGIGQGFMAVNYPSQRAKPEDKVVCITINPLQPCYNCYQEYIIGRERESILLHILLCKCIADN